MRVFVVCGRACVYVFFCARMSVLCMCVRGGRIVCVCVWCACMLRVCEVCVVYVWCVYVRVVD